MLVGKLGREGMLDKGVVYKRIVLMDKLLLLGMEQLAVSAYAAGLLLAPALGFLSDLDLHLIIRSWITLIRHCIRSIWNKYKNPKLEKLQANLDLGLSIFLELLLELSLHLSLLQ